MVLDGNTASAGRGHRVEQALELFVGVDVRDKGGGGPDGKQACVEVCPVGAIKFTAEIPVQAGDEGYKVNLRTKNWWKLGYPRD